MNDYGYTTGSIVWEVVKKILLVAAIVVFFPIAVILEVLKLSNV